MSHPIHNTSRWRKFSAKVLREEPLCRHCQAKGLVRPSEEADHIIPLEVDDSEANAYGRDGVQALCKGCHRIKTAMEYREKGRARYRQVNLDGSLT